MCLSCPWWQDAENHKPVLMFDLMLYKKLTEVQGPPTPHFGWKPTAVTSQRNWWACDVRDMHQHSWLSWKTKANPVRYWIGKALDITLFPQKSCSSIEVSIILVAMGWDVPGWTTAWPLHPCTVLTGGFLTWHYSILNKRYKNHSYISIQLLQLLQLCWCGASKATIEKTWLVICSAPLNLP